MLARSPLRRAALLLSTCCALGATLAPRGADAFVLPVRIVEGFPFATTTADVRVLLARISVERMERLAGDPAGGLWWVEADLLLRNESRNDVQLELFAPDVATYTEDTIVTRDGVAAATAPSRLALDPAFPGVAFDSGRLASLALPAEGVATVRISRIVAGTVDAYGQVTIELDTHLLGAHWAGEIDDASIVLRLDERPIGLVATVPASAVYDEPEAGAVWFPRLWEPARPFTISYVPPWSALLLAAIVEDCPPPWDVVRGITEGGFGATVSSLAAYDLPTLQFCAGLPHVLHGAPLGSQAARDQLGAIDLSRYLPGPHRGPVYRENPLFEERFLSEVEAIYRRTLLSVLAPPPIEP